MIWKVWPSLSKYEASTSGLIRNIKSGRVLSPYVCPRGYKRYAFRINGKLKSFSGHRIIAETFLGPSKLQVNHKNLKPSDNRIKNLEYCTQLENTRHALANGVKFGNPGEKNGRNKYSKSQVSQVKVLLNKGLRPVDIVKETGVSRDIIYLVSRNKIWKSKQGFHGLTRK